MLNAINTYQSTDEIGKVKEALPSSVSLPHYHYHPFYEIDNYSRKMSVYFEIAWVWNAAIRN